VDQSYNYKLSDFTLIGWVLIITTSVVLLGGAFLLARWLDEWLPPGAGYGYIVLAIPGVLYMAAFWAICKARGIRLVKEGAGR
jgi:hypothetical protein